MLPTIPVHNTIPIVPFYSQFTDISSTSWQKVGCGITSLAMIIDYYKPNAVSVDTLLTRGIAGGAYDNNAGWVHKDLILLAKKYGLTGNSYDMRALSKDAAFTQFKKSLQDGPVMASVHYKFDPKNPIPHLVVIDGIEGDIVYYNDPALKSGTKEISTEKFLKAWKQKFIVIRPEIINEANTQKVAMASLHLLTPITTSY
jgi:ABC-type bacteriocin/lantibiotic exporter with double-glycine peptidase domain